MQVVVEVVREGSEAGEGRADDNDDDDDDDDEDKDVDEDDDEDDDDEYSGILRNCNALLRNILYYCRILHNSHDDSAYS
jgi:TATA-binding protein-associated factor Taf7